jgi:hypothetical protein
VTESSTGHTAAINVVVTAKGAVVASVIKYAPPSPKGRTYYEGSERIVFASNNTFTRGWVEGDYAETDTSGHYVYTDRATGTYSLNEAAKTVTGTPEKVTWDDTLLTKAQWKTAVQAYFEALKTTYEAKNGAGSFAKYLLENTGYSSISDYVEYAANAAFASVTFAYSFSDDGKALFLEQALPANKGTNELSGKTLHGVSIWEDDDTPIPDENETYVFAAGGTYTYTGSRWGISTITTGNYAVSLKWVYLQPLTVDGKTRSQYYETVGESGDSSRYPSVENYRASQTNSQFGHEESSYNLTNGTVGWED